MIEEAAAQPIGVFRPGGPAGDGVVQGDDAHPALQQGAEARLHLRLGLDEAGTARGAEVDARHVVEHQGVEAVHGLRVHQPPRGGLVDEGGLHPFHLLEHGA